MLETMQSTVIHGIELLHFCEPSENTRFAIDKPYVKNGYLTATDARILIAFPTSEPDTVLDRRTPDPFHVLDKVKDVDVSTEWPEEFIGCPVCGPVKVKFPALPTKCRTCDGNGELRCDLGHDHDCSDCNCRGMVGGYRSHSEDPLCNIALGGRKFDRAYISRINSLPRPLKYCVVNDMLVAHGPNEMIVVLMAFDLDSGR